MKKINSLLLLLLLLIPHFVYAEESCDNKGVSIKMIELKKMNGLTEELSDVTLEDNKINFDVKMYEVRDSIEYTLIIKNDSDKDYVVDDKNINEESSIIEYKLEPKDGTNRVKKGTEEEFVLTTTYKNEVEQEQFRAGKFDASGDVLFSVEAPSLFPIDITNPKTGSLFFIIVGIFLTISIVFLFKIKNKKLQFFIFSVFLLLPITVLADCNYNIELKSNIIIGYVKPNDCIYDGELVQGAEYTNGQYTYRYMQESEYINSTRLYGWRNIESDGWGVALTDKESTEPVITKLCTTINDKPIVSMRSMFHNSKTVSIDTSSFDTRNVTSMYELFFGCSSLTDIDVTNFDTSNVTSMPAMFYGCSNLQNIDLSNFDVSKVTNFGEMFYNTPNLISLNLDNFNFSTPASGIFYGADSLKSISAKNWKIPSNFQHAFFRSMSGGESIQEIDVTGWDLSHINDLSGLFASNGVNSGNGKGLKHIIGLNTWNTSNITNMSSLFDGLISLETIDLSSFDTSKVTTMKNLFNGCVSLITLNMDGWNFSSMTDLLNLNFMFTDDSSLKTISMKNWIIPEKFDSTIGCRYSGLCTTSLESIDVTGWDLRNAKNIEGLFGNNYTKEIIGLDTWDTSNITNINGMFQFDYNLTELDLSSFDTSKVVSSKWMFMDDSKLKLIKVSDSFTMAQISSENSELMFRGCTSLVGGNGTTFNSNYMDKTYARIDTAVTPGYFTRK